MTIAWEQLVKTGHPASDAQVVEGLAARARAEGLAIQAAPVMGGGMHVRAYRAAPAAWAQQAQQARQMPATQAPPLSARFSAPVAAVPHGPPRNVAWAQPVGAQARQQPGWGAPPQGHVHVAHGQAVAPRAAPARPPSATLEAPLVQAGALSTSQGLEAFRARSIYAATGPAPALFQDLAAIGYLDQQLEARRSKWGWATTIVGITVFLSFIPCVMLPILLVGWVVALVIWGFILRAYGAAKKADMENARYVLAHRLLYLIEPDLDPRQPITLRICFSPHDERRKIKSHRKLEVPRGVGAWDEYVYEDDFLHLTARGADGSKIKLVLTETIRERKGWKRGAAGKTKSKSKVQARFGVDLGVEVKTSKHGALAKLRESAWRAVRLPVLAKAKALAVEPDGVSLSVVSRAPWSVTTRDAGGRPQIVHGAAKLGGLSRLPGSTIDAFDCAAMALLSAYQILNFSAKASKPKAA